MNLNFLRMVICTVIVSVMTIAGLTLRATSATLGQNSSSKPGTVTIKATIEEIDTANRILTLKGPKGKLVKVKATESVKRFDQLKVGDVVTASYSESVAIRFRKPGDPAPAQEQAAVVKRADGKPGAAVVLEETITVTIEEIDRAGSSVTIKGSDGKSHSVRVRDTKLLEGLKVGDQVDIVYKLGVLLKADSAAK